MNATAKALLDDLEISNGEFPFEETWNRVKDDYLGGRIEFDDWKKYWEERRENEREELKDISIEEDSLVNSFIWEEDRVLKKRVFPIDNHNEYFFFGFLLPKEEDEIDSKGNVLGRKQTTRPCIINSDGNLIQITKAAKQNEKLEFENIPLSLPKRWKLEDIKNFLDNKEGVNRIELLNKIVGQYEKYVYIRNPTWYKILAIWDIGTYFYPLFEAYPFIENRGIAGTGKTKTMSISSLISFNGGQIMVNPSESTLFRETDEVRGTKYIDEAEKLWVFNKSTKQYEGDVRTELINASYTKEAKVPRQEKIGNKFVTKWYSPYSPTQLSSINGLFGATETRAITRISVKSPNEDKRGEIEPTEDRNEPIWEEIRDKCYRFALIDWKNILELYKNFPKDCGLKRRDYQIWKPILAISKYISEEVYKEILRFAMELTTRRIDDLVPESSFDYMCLQSLKETIESSSSDKIYVDAIKMKYCAIKGDEDGKRDVYLNRNISGHLDKLGFKEMRNRDKNRSFFAVTKEIFNEIVGPICPNLVIISTSSTSSTPLFNNNNKIDVDSVAINGDEKNDGVVIVAINGDDVDTWKKEGSKKPSQTLPICPTCEKEMTLQNSTFGKKYYCPNFAYCGQKLEIKNSEVLQE